MKMFKIFLLLFVISCDFTSAVNKEILNAQDHLLHQKYSEAITTYQNILKHNLPDSLKVKIYYQIAEVYSLYLNDGSKAVDAYEQIEILTQDLTWKIKAREKIAEIYFTMLKDFSKSASSYRSLIDGKIETEKKDFYEFRLGISLRKLNKYIECEEIFKKISLNEKSNFYVLSFYELGLSYFYKKDWQKAIEAWFEYLKREKNKENIVLTKFMIANTYETNEKLKEAYDIYYSIASEYPNTEVIKARIKSLYTRRMARKR